MQQYNKAVSVNDLRLSFRSEVVSNSHVLFTDADGESVYCGDTVYFYVKGEVFPHNGVVIRSGEFLYIKCYSTFMDTYVLYPIIGKCEEQL